MSHSESKTIISQSAAQTEAIARKLATNLIGGEVIELVADLGGGKTTFVRGLGRGIGAKGQVSSPSFTTCNQYMGSKLELIHFDFYRLDGPGVMENNLVEFIGKPGVVVVIEWGEVVNQLLPTERLSINFGVTSENSRQLIITYPKSLEYLLEGI